MLTVQICFFALFLISKLHAEEEPKYYNFRSTFRTPKDTPKRNYDDFEILERASFHSEGSETSSLTPNKSDSPKATASAQIHVKIADKRSLKENEPAKPTNDVDDTLKKLLIMLIKPLVENNNGGGRINPFFPFPPSPHPSPPYASLLGGLSALSTLAGTSNNPEAVKKAAKIVHKLKEQLKAASVENEIESDIKKKKNPDEVPALKITLNNKPMKLQMGDGEENASVAEKSEKLVDLAKLYPLLLKSDDDDDDDEIVVEEKPKRRKKKPKLKVIDPLEVYMRKVLTPNFGFVENCPLCGVLNYNGATCNCNPLLTSALNSISPLRYDLNNYLTPKIPLNNLLTPKVLPATTPRSEILATEFVVHVPVLIKNKQPSSNYNNLANYPLLSSLLPNYTI